MMKMMMFLLLYVSPPDALNAIAFKEAGTAKLCTLSLMGAGPC